MIKSMPLMKVLMMNYDLEYIDEIDPASEYEVMPE